MALTPEQIGRLQTRAREVGERTAWDLQFRVLPHPKYVTTAAGPTDSTMVGPSKLSEGDAADIPTSRSAWKAARW